MIVGRRYMHLSIIRNREGGCDTSTSLQRKPTFSLEYVFVLLTPYTLLAGVMRRGNG